MLCLSKHVVIFSAKMQKKASILELGSFHPDITHSWKKEVQVKWNFQRTTVDEYLIVFLSIKLYGIKFRCINVGKQLKCQNIYM